VITNPSSKKTVEFVINLPGNNENGDKLLLPIDAKFPKDIYESLLNAYDTCDKDLIKKSKQELASTIIKMAKDIKEKYIYPPKTTDFAIMFLPFEGLFSEVVKDTELVTKIQKEYKVTITGPSTLSAILNSLQIGFRTLVLQKRGSEVWEVLEGVKKEFSNFSGLIGKAQKNIQIGLGQLDDVLGVRTRAIEKNLIKVDKLENSQDDPTIVKLIK
jgi:DNA recombination protein RmuC